MSLVADYVAKFTKPAHERLFKVSIHSSTQARGIDGVLRPAAPGDEIVVDRETATHLVGRGTILGECDRAGNLVKLAPAEVVPLPEPKPAAPSPYGDPIFDRWHDLAERHRVLADRVRLLQEFIARRTPTTQPPESWSAPTKQTIHRATRALDQAREALAAFDRGALAEAHIYAGQACVAAYDEMEVARDRLEAGAFQLFTLRVDALGLLPSGVARLFGQSALAAKYVLGHWNGPSRKLAWGADGQQRDFCPDDGAALFAFTKQYRQRLEHISALQKELDAEHAKAARVLRKPVVL